MKTSVIEVRDMLSVLSVSGVEERIGEVPGVESATVNYAAGNATVRYDETRLAAGDIKAAVHQSGNGSAGEPQPKPAGEQKTHEGRPAPDSKPSTRASALPKAAPIAPAAAPAAAPAPAPPAVGGHKDHAAPDTKPSTQTAVAPKAASLPPATPVRVTSAAEASPVAKSLAPAANDPRSHSWKVSAFSLATTLGAAYISCAIFDLLFPLFGLLAALASAIPLPISGSALGFLTGFALLTVAGFVLGALHGLAAEFWSKKLQ